MAKLTKAQANDEYMAGMRAKGFDVVFLSELPHPKSTRNCNLILAINGNLVLIVDEV